MIALGATAGLRRAEISRVRGDDVHPAIGGPILVVRGKGDKVREVPITDELAAMIAAEAQELLGHASVSTTQIYTAIPAEAARRAVASAASSILLAA